LLVAALVVVVGAILGVAGFAFEQTRADWRPHATRTALGWRVSQPYLGINEPALAGDHLALQAGPYTIVMDLGSGATKLVGAARDAQSVLPPVVSPRAAVWAEYSGGAGRKAQVYSYDFSSRRRQRLLETSAALQDTPAVVGSTAYWLSGMDATTTVVACDIAGGRQRVLASGSGLGPFPVLADGAFVVWSHQERALAPFAMTVFDTVGGTTSDLVLPGQSSGAVFDTPILAKGTLAWLRIDEQSDVATITTYDLHTLVAGQVASAKGLVGPGFDGTTVVWAQPAVGGAGMALMGLRLAGGGPFRIADLPDGVHSVMVSGSRVAWWAGTGSGSWVETSRLPQ
jgi:hypothetical protein